MTLEFTKMNGAGNDFLLLDNRSGRIRLSRTQVARLCHRQRGVGADGLLLLEPAHTNEADWAWTFYNSDGSDAEMCGNGARCFARFIERLTGPCERARFETLAGVIEAEFDGDLVTVNLTPPHGLKLDQLLDTPDGAFKVHSINTGVPHAVVFVESADRVKLIETGAALRLHPVFEPAGTNVNFVQALAPGRIRVRTYERGVEGETLACGTGVAASALVYALLKNVAPPIRVNVQGGDTLEVRFQRDGDALSDVRLKGPAEFVFTGRIDLNTAAS